MKNRVAIVLGAGGFIGSHLVKRLKKEGHFVIGVDLKKPDFSETQADRFHVGDLRDPSFVSQILYQPDSYVFQLAADMGGAQYIFSGDNDANVMHNSALINLNVAHFANLYKIGKLFYSSSACIYPKTIQEDVNNSGLKEYQAYPVNPDSEYGYEKIFSERLYDSFRRNYGLDIRVARFHNIFGEEGTWFGGKEKAPAAMLRKVCTANDGQEIEVLGDGLQTRSFLYIDECLEGIMRLMESDYFSPINIGSDEMVSINQLAQLAIDISGKELKIKNVPTNVQGVRGRNSDNTLIKEVLGWRPTQSLRTGMEKTYKWINEQVNGNI
jgi:GDP-D-mannose 3', 5'-epimerase